MNSNKGHVPIRTCVICRSKKAKKELIRLILDKDKRVIVDELKKKEGRGIYLCNEIPCREKFSKNKGLNRFFRTDTAVIKGLDFK
ncbi:MAG: YlxR family protein [Deltaproteobacteria bacterium]|nr:YlxR family protein [Deltaproteobacteria bacterium]